MMSVTALALSLLQVSVSVCRQINNYVIHTALKEDFFLHMTTATTAAAATGTGSTSSTSMEESTTPMRSTITSTTTTTQGTLKYQKAIHSQ